MKILFVALAESIHTARWISQVSQIKWSIGLFPSIDYGYSHPRLSKLKVFYSFYGRSGLNNTKCNRFGVNVLFDPLAATIKRILKFFIPKYQEIYLSLVIKTFKPDIIHSLEMQSGAYLVNRVKQSWKGAFPPWIISNWGSDIYLFGKDPQHSKQIRECLSNCDYYMCECNRDVKLAKKYGLKGKVLGILPNAGGYDVDKYRKYITILPSKRKRIMLKGYQGWAGRSLVALEAIDSLGDLLAKQGYSLTLYSTLGNVEVENKAKDICDRHSLKLDITSPNTDHDEIIKLHCKARISIGLSMSDGISTSLLEAMIAGSYPIQSYTACADEWILDGVTGELVPPEDVGAVEKAISKAIKNDQLVDRAARLNLRTIRERGDYELVRKQVIELYNEVCIN